jgi:hypothetical protein
LPKVRLQNYLIGAACNAKRWVRPIAWEMKQAAVSVTQKLAEAKDAAAALAAGI